MKKAFKKYMVTVIKIRRGGYRVAEDGIFLNEGDVLCGYSHPQHEANKYFDVWFTSDKNLDPDNYVTLGRIREVFEDTYITKLGVFKIQEVTDGKEKATTH